MSTTWTGGGCGPRRAPEVANFTAPDDDGVDAHIRRAEAEQRWEEFLKEQAERDKVEAERKAKTVAWEAEYNRVRSVPPEGEFVANDAVIFVERSDPGRPVAAFMLFRTTVVDEPHLPTWYLAKSKRHGLKAFLIRGSRDQVLETHEWLVADGGSVILCGKVRVVGKSQSGKSLHVELVEGAQLR